MIGSLPPNESALVLRMFVFLALGVWAARPLARRLVPTPERPDGGWIAALLLAWAVMGWVPWALSAVGLVPMQSAAFAGLGVLLAARLAFGPAPADPRGAASLGAGFIVLFWLGLAQRMGEAQLTGLEKFTNMGFLAAVMRAEWMPPQDAWFAGETLNYYYVGQAMAGVWGHMMGASPAETYQLVMAMLFSLCGLAIWQVTAGLSAPFGQRVAWVLGSAAMILGLYGGNGHSVLYTLFREWMPATGAAFFFPDSTRFIGFDPPTDDKGFTEFLAYAFAVGDLHAHVVATPVFLLGVMVLLAMLGCRDRPIATHDRDGARPVVAKAGGVTLLRSVAFGWIIGLCLSMNSWDVAILGLLGLLVWVTVSLGLCTGMSRARGDTPGVRLDRLGLAAVVVIAVGLLTAIPFLGSFIPFASGIMAAPARSPAWQVLVLYGYLLPAAALVVALVVSGSRGLNPQTRAGALPTAIVPISLLFLCGALLVMIPEVIMVRDIYGLDFARANTMFKLTFRAQTLMLIAAFAVLAPVVMRGWQWVGTGMIAGAMLIAPLAYLPHIATPPDKITKLDGLAFLGPERGLVAFAERLALAPGEAIIEASGLSFDESARVSALTGLPTVIGWSGHQWLWRNDFERVQRRAKDVERFYTQASQADRCQIIRRYGIRYVILGLIERSIYPDINEQAIRELGVTIYDTENASIVQITAAGCNSHYSDGREAQ